MEGKEVKEYLLKKPDIKEDLEPKLEDELDQEYCRLQLGEVEDKSYAGGICVHKDGETYFLLYSPWLGFQDVECRLAYHVLAVMYEKMDLEMLEHERHVYRTCSYPEKEDLDKAYSLATNFAKILNTGSFKSLTSELEEIVKK